MTPDKVPEVYRDLLTCVVCDKGGVRMNKCAKYFSVSYWGQECQVGDWARNKRLCDSVMVKVFEEKGIGLVASRDFKIGDLILTDNAVVCGIHSRTGSFKQLQAKERSG